jgi:hypothetical protein
MSAVVTSAMLPATASVNRLRLFVAFRTHIAHAPPLERLDELSKPYFNALQPSPRLRPTDPAGRPNGYFSGLLQKANS